MDYRNADDAWLLKAAAAGDREAFAAFYRRWLPAVTRYHLRRTRALAVRDRRAQAGR